MGRQWVSRISFAFVILLLAGGVIAAATAQGLVASQVDSNDGGAWLLKGDAGSVGHVNHSVMELTSAVNVGKAGGEFAVTQARDVVAVHDQGLNVVVLVDDSLNRQAANVEVPSGADVVAVPGGVFVADTDEGRVWWVERIRFTELSQIGEAEPSVEAGVPVVFTVAPDGTAIVVSESKQVWQFNPTQTGEAGVSEIPFLGGANIDTTDDLALTTAGGRLVVLDRGTGIAYTTIEDEVVEFDLAGAARQPLVLQQPSVDGSRFVAIRGDGVVRDANLATGGVASLPVVEGLSPLEPIVHQGCVFAVTREPAVLHRLCPGETETRERRLSGSGRHMFLRLVNGWIWVNDGDTGSVWVAPPEGELTEVDDWGIVLGTRQIDTSEGTIESEVPLEEELVENPDDATAEVVSADRQTDEDEKNDIPVANPDFAATRPERPVVVDVIANDEDADGDVLVVSWVTEEVASGQVTITADRAALQFAPAPGFAGQTAFEYEIDDGRGGTATAEVQIDVVPTDQNRAPIAVTDVAATRSGSPVSVNVLANDSDPDGDSLVLVAATVEAGRVSFTPDGQIVYYPVVAADQGRVELAYVVADEYGETAEGKLIIAIRPATSNNEPDARNDTAVGVVGSPITFNVLHNDTDPDGDPLIVIKPPEDQRITLTTDGELFFVPDKAETVIFTYVISDGSESDSAQVRIEVEEVDYNRPPVPIRDDIALARGTSGVVYALDNDGDPDGDVLTIANWFPPEGLEAELIEGRGFRLKVSHNAGSSLVMPYTITDGQSEPVWSSVVVTVVDADTSNQPPLAADDYVEARPGVPTIVDVLANDTDPEGDILKLVGVSETPNARVELAGDRVRVSLEPDQRGGFGFSYDVEDSAGNRASAVVTVRVVGAAEPNRAPVARPDIARTAQGQWVSLDVAANDDDPDGDPVVVIFYGQGANGIVEQVDSRTLVYTPDPDFTGTDTFEYAIQDPTGDQARSEVIVGVFPKSAENREPVANDDRAVFAIGRTNIVVPVLVNDSDPDGDPLVITHASTPRRGTAEISGDGLVLVVDPPLDLDDGDEITLTYEIQDQRGGSSGAVVSLVARETVGVQPPIAVDDIVGPVRPGSQIDVPVLANDIDPDGNAAALSVSSEDPALTVLSDRRIRVTATEATTQHWYTVTDVDGLSSSGVITVFVVDNQPPVIEPLEKVTEFNTSIEIDVTPQASDPDGDPLEYKCCQDRRGGLFEVLTETSDELRVRFTPNDDFTGTAAFSYIVDDRQGHEVSSTVRIEVLPPENTPPEAGTGTATVEAGSVTVLDLLQFASDSDGDALSVTETGRTGGDVTSARSGNSVTLEAAFEVPAGTTDSMSYTVSDGEDSATGVLEITVTETTKDPPLAVPDTEGNVTNQGEPITIDVLANDIDPIGELLTIVQISGTSDGSTAVTPDGEITFTPDPLFFGITSFTYTIEDVAARQSIAEVQVNVLGRPSAPERPAVTGGNAEVIITWIEPADNGATLDSYEIEASDGQVVSLNRTQGHTWTGLTNGQTYTFRVRAHNVAGWGDWSDPSPEVTPDTLAEVPAAPSLTFGDEEIEVAWVAPYNEGSAISNYVLQSSEGILIDVGNVNTYTWRGLQNGTAYTFSIAAENGAGLTTFGPPSDPETPAREPDAPAPPDRSRGSNQVDLTWSEPVNNGDSVIEYEARITPGGTVTSVGSAESYTWASLPNGVEVTFSIRGRNKAGWSPWSAESVPVTPCGIPDAVPSLTATRGDQQATLTWSSPDPQGCVIQQYSITATHSGGSLTNYVGGEADIGAIGVARTHDFAGLTNGTSYTFEIRPVNEVGTGTGTTSAAVIPAGPPFATTISGSPINVGAVRLTWPAAPDNGSSITSYEVQVNGSTTMSTAATSYDWTGLSNGTSYGFQVRAVNDVGPGPWSNTVNVTTWGTPSQPSTPTISAGDSQLTANWNAPATNGSPIINYEVDIEPGGSPETTATSYTFTGLSNGSSYQIRVRAQNAVGWSPWSSYRTGTPVDPRRVTVSKGGSAPAGNYVNVSISGFSPNTTYNVDWLSNRFSGDWCNDANGSYYQTVRTGSTGSASIWEDNTCFYGYWGDEVWVTVGGVSSNRVTW